MMAFVQKNVAPQREEAPGIAAASSGKKKMQRTARKKVATGRKQV
jgi:hypothetical protein